jgi:hypothetical protein
MTPSKIFYTITKVVGENSFELSIPPFLGLHLYLMWNYFNHIFHLSWTLQTHGQALGPYRNQS